MTMKPNNKNRRHSYRNGGYRKTESGYDNKKPAEPQESKIQKVLQEHADEVLAELAVKMDEEFMDTGKDLAELYRAVCTAAAKLPVMELHTELICVTNSEDGLTVVFNRESAKSERGHIDFDDFDSLNEFDDEEEGMLYDGD